MTTIQARSQSRLGCRFCKSLCNSGSTHQVYLPSRGPYQQTGDSSVLSLQLHGTAKVPHCFSETFRFLKLLLDQALKFQKKNFWENLKRLDLFLCVSFLSRILVPQVLAAFITLYFNLYLFHIVKLSEVLLDSLNLSCTPLQESWFLSTGQKLINIPRRKEAHKISAHLLVITFFSSQLAPQLFKFFKQIILYFVQIFCYSQGRWCSAIS